MLIPILVQTANIIDAKVDTFTDSMIEDIQDIIKVEIEEGIIFEHGVLPPRYKELKEEMKTIINNYILENMKLSWLEKPKEVVQEAE
jgi:hypothetical protein